MAAKKTASAKKAAPAEKAAAATTSAAAKKAASAPAKKASAPAKKAASAPAKAAAAASQGTPRREQRPAKAGAASKHATGTAVADTLEVKDGEQAWTPEEIAEVKATLESDAVRLRAEISAAETEIGHLLREGGEGAGNDQADVGSNTFERDHEMSMAKNARANLELVEAAIQRIDEGSYGVCESCGKPIGKMRLQAFPRATLCMECKQRQERR